MFFTHGKELFKKLRRSPLSADARDSVQVALKWHSSYIQLLIQVALKIHMTGLYNIKTVTT